MIPSLSSPSLRRSAPALVLLASLAVACQSGTGGGSGVETRSDTLMEVSLELPKARFRQPRASVIDVQHYGIDLELFPPSRSIEGQCTVRFTSLQNDLLRVALDFAGLEVLAVEDASGRELGFTHRGETLFVDLASVLSEGDAAELTVFYGGQPRKGLWFAGDRDGVPTHVFTQGECEDSRWWFPCWDAPSDFATSEVRVTMPAAWTSVGAGERTDRQAGPSTVTETWSMSRPHAVYLTTLVAGEFAVRTDDWEGTPLLYLAEPHYVKWLDASFNETKAILSFLSDLTGVRYPYAKYSQACVENFPFGGMENISATTLTTLTLDDERGTRDDQSHGLVAHEAAHQWFGNLLTCQDWSHVWLNEGFATYAALLYFEHTRGVDDFRVRVRDAQEEYIAEEQKARRPIVYSVYKDPMDLFGDHVYPGGASRLHLLRSILGDDLFVEGVRTYVSEGAGRPVSTANLRRAFEQVSGEDLDWFFEQWIESPGYPEIETRWSWDETERRLELDVAQVQLPDGGVPAAFRMPVDVEVRDRAGIAKHRVWVTKRRQAFQFPADFEPIWVRFDKYGWIPKRHRAQKSPDEWLAIAKEDDDVNGRRDALKALGSLLETTQNAELRAVYVAEVVSRLKRDSSPAVRAAAAVVAGRAGGLEARAQLLESAVTDADAEVREVSLRALERWGPNPELAQFAREQFDAGYSWDTMGAAAGLVVAAAPQEAYGWLTKQLLLVDSPHDQLRVTLIEHLGGLDHLGVNSQLEEWARDDSAHSLARAAAVRELGKRARGRTSIASFLLDLLDTPDFRLRAAVVEALGEFRDPRTRRELYAYYQRTVFPREKRVIEAALGTGL